MRWYFLLFVVCTTVAAHSICAQDAIPITAQFRHNLIILTPTVRDGSTLEFYTDTGGGWNAISAEAANQLNLSVIETLKDEDGSNLSIVEFPEPASGVIFPKPSSDYLRGGLIVANGNQMKPHQGFLGGRWFADRVWEFNYLNKTLATLENTFKGAAQAHVLSLGFQTNSTGKRTMHFPRVAAKIDHHEYQFLFDTGAKITLSESGSKSLQLPAETSIGGGFISASIFDTWLEKHPTWLVVKGGDKIGIHSFDLIQVPTVTIAGHTVGPVWFAKREDSNFTEYMSAMMDKPIVGAVGGSLFQYFRIIVDYPNAQAHFFRK